MNSNTIIKRHELLEIMNRPEVKLVDGSWYLPAHNRDAVAEYKAARIGEAVFFDIDAISDTSVDLPHMLPDAASFAKAVGKMGISHSDEIIVYDGAGIFSAARVWWMFRLMGAQNVRVLEGGMDGWRSADMPVNTDAPHVPEPVTFVANLDYTKVRSLDQMMENTVSGDAVVLDARPADRFTGQTPEPREGLASGHIPGSKSLPFGQLFDGETLKDPDELTDLFRGLGIEQSVPVITTCGSGVTAAIITLALEHAGLHNTGLYDGSWAEWGKAKEVPIATGSD